MTDATPSSNLPLSPPELSTIVTDPYLREQTATALENEPELTIAMRHYAYITFTIQRLENELRFHLQEQLDMFHNMTAHRQFRAQLRPVVRELRQRTRRGHPYLRTPSPVPPLEFDTVLFQRRTPPVQTSSNYISSSSSGSSNADDIYSLYSSPPEREETPNNEGNREISPDPNNILNPLDRPLGTVTITPPHGSPLNPINVDLLPDPVITPSIEQNIAGPSRLVCQKCHRTGHLENDCLFRRPHTCDLCKREGHTRPNCPNQVVCYQCGKPNHYRTECPERRRR